MKSVSYTVTVDIDVWDGRALIQAARAKARADGHPLKHCTTLDALQWLVDPGTSPPGTTIIGSDSRKMGDV